jgi:hypothetical protein
VVRNVEILGKKFLKNGQIWRKKVMKLPRFFWTILALILLLKESYIANRF